MGYSQTAGPKRQKIEKAATCAFRRQSGPFHFLRLSLAQLAKSVIAQESTSWESVTPPANRHPMTAHQAAMGDPSTPHPHLLVRYVPGTGRLPDNFGGALSAWYQVIEEESGPLLSELWSSRGLHAYLGLLAAGVYSAPRVERLYILMVDRYIEVNVLNSFFSVQAIPYTAK